MRTVTYDDVILIMSASIFFLGICTFLIGVFVLVARAMGKDIRTITAQTTRLAQKGIAEGVPGLVGNASALMGAVQEMVKTAAGIGVFLTALGIGMMSLSYYLMQQINWLT